jgi:hypothetical protein
MDQQNMTSYPLSTLNSTFEPITEKKPLPLELHCEWLQFLPTPNAVQCLPNLGRRIFALNKKEVKKKWRAWQVWQVFAALGTNTIIKKISLFISWSDLPKCSNRAESKWALRKRMLGNNWRKYVVKFFPSPQFVDSRHRQFI